MSCGANMSCRASGFKFGPSISILSSYAYARNEGSDETDSSEPSLIADVIRVRTKMYLSYYIMHVI